VIGAAAVSGQHLGNYVTTATDTNATINERCFLCGSCREVVTRTVKARRSVDREFYTESFEDST
jgi:hypothetical protein